MSALSQRVASAIAAAATSGEAAWDELGGPNATIQWDGREKYVISWPAPFPGTGTVVITVEDKR